MGSSVCMRFIQCILYIYLNVLIAPAFNVPQPSTCNGRQEFTLPHYKFIFLMEFIITIFMA